MVSYCGGHAWSRGPSIEAEAFKLAQQCPHGWDSQRDAPVVRKNKVRETVYRVPPKGMGFLTGFLIVTGFIDSPVTLMIPRASARIRALRYYHERDALMTAIRGK